MSPDALEEFVLIEVSRLQRMAMEMRNVDLESAGDNVGDLPVVDHDGRCPTEMRGEDERGQLRLRA